MSEPNGLDWRSIRDASLGGLVSAGAALLLLCIESGRPRSATVIPASLFALALPIFVVAAWMNETNAIRSFSRRGKIALGWLTATAAALTFLGFVILAFHFSGWVGAAMLASTMVVGLTVLITVAEGRSRRAGLSLQR